jgi:hypothetical protein
MPKSPIHSHSHSQPKFSLLGLTRDQLAEKLGVSPWTIDEWRRKRIIPFYKIGQVGRGGLVRYDFERVKAALLLTEVTSRTPERREILTRPNA